MERRIIQVHEDECTGCGLCVKACPFGALGMLNGKAVLLRDEYCNGLGECIPACPHDAIYFFIRETVPFNEQAAERHARSLHPSLRPAHRPAPHAAGHAAAQKTPAEDTQRPAQWPVQLLMIEDGSFLDGADAVLCADCAPFVAPGIMEKYIGDKALLVACPKYQKEEDIRRKLEDLLKKHDVHSITLIQMDVPSCSGLEYALSKAVEESGRKIPGEMIRITKKGEVQAGFGD